MNSSVDFSTDSPRLGFWAGLEGYSKKLIFCLSLATSADLSRRVAEIPPRPTAITERTRRR